jgi:hypothetical protein
MISRLIMCLSLILIGSGTLNSCRADDSSAVYATNEFIPGANIEQRWCVLSSKLPSLLGQSRDEVQSTFGVHKTSGANVV